MEEQYLQITKEHSKKMNKLGLRTYTETRLFDGQKKIIGYLINLSDILNFLEHEVLLSEKMKRRHEKVKKLNEKLNILKSQIDALEKDLESIDINKKIEEIIERKKALVQ